MRCVALRFRPAPRGTATQRTTFDVNELSEPLYLKSRLFLLKKAKQRSICKQEAFEKCLAHSPLRTAARRLF